LYLKSLQLILRHQIWFLVKDKGLPSELETVIYDLWTLRITQLGSRIASAGKENEPSSQVYSTLESEDETTDHERGTLSTPKGRDKKLSSAPNLYDCLVLCYLGMHTLRLPLTPGDIYAWVTDGKMAFRGAIKLLPMAMKDRLPSSYHSSLTPHTMMSYKRFYATLTSLQISFEKDHGVLWPPLNLQLLLFRYIKELALPLQLYDATLRLQDLLGYTFVLQHNGRQAIGMAHLPEAQLIGCLIVCIKLFYPFDKIKRLPESVAEPAALVVDWKKWCKYMNAADKEQRQGETNFTTEELTKLQESDVFEMKPEQLDQYLGFYDDTFLDDAEIQRTRDNDDFRNALFDMFPIEGQEQRQPAQLSEGRPYDSMLKTVRDVQASMETAEIVADDQGEENALRPGQMYPVWKEVQDLPQRAVMFYEAAAKIAGFSVDLLVMAVYAVEVRLERWRRQQKEGTRTREA
jgi:RNA polymerase I-specific transcription initiation factor RRN7